MNDFRNSLNHQKSQIKSYRDLIVWQKSMKLVLLTYSLTKKYPKEELYSLVNQTRRCVVSIPSNIAEGSRRGTKKDFRSFLLNSFGSGAELETQLEIARELGFYNEKDFEKVNFLLEEVMKILNKMIFSMKN